MKQIVILDDYQNVALKMADWSQLQADHDVKVVNRHLAGKAEQVAALGNANVLVCNRERTPITAELVAELPNLELVITSGMRNNSIDVAACNAAGVTVCGTATLGYPTAELTIALMTSFFRHLPGQADSLRGGGWQTKVGRELRGKTLGIVGFGRIGKDVARVGLALGMTVLANSRSLTPEKAKEDGVTCANLDQLLRQSDVVSIHLSVNPDSRGLLGAAEFAKMKNSALLINTSRAIVVDQDAMIDALHSGTIGGAALDVYDTEPLPADHALLTTPNTLLSPHLGYVTEENYQLSFGEAVENIQAWLDGNPKRVLTP